MFITLFKRIGWFLMLVLVQALILNKICFLGYATPCLYIYLLLKFDDNISKNVLLLWGFTLGLAVDMFSNTPGIHAAATTLLALARPLLLRLFAPRDATDGLTPSIRHMGTGAFIRYATSALLIQQTAFILLVYFSLSQPLVMFLKIIASTLLSVLLIWAIEKTTE